MFGHHSYIGYTLLFCIPPLILMWLRREFFAILRRNIRSIVLSTLALTVYGSLIWPVALKYGAWGYHADRITGVKLLGYVYVDDVLWWILVSLVISSFIVISRDYEDRGVDIVWHEITSLVRSFKSAFQGFRAVTLERNPTVHVAVAAFVILEGIFLKISATEWFVVALAIGLVIGFELMNAAVERLANKLGTNPDEDIRLIKDAAAAGVLISALAAAAVGLKIFFARILYFLNHTSP